jgi:hypothetical protein
MNFNFNARRLAHLFCPFYQDSMTDGSSWPVR